jgi:hypothetical protein
LLDGGDTVEYITCGRIQIKIESGPDVEISGSVQICPTPNYVIKQGEDNFIVLVGANSKDAIKRLRLDHIFQNIRPDLLCILAAAAIASTTLEITVDYGEKDNRKAPPITAVRIPAALGS